MLIIGAFLQNRFVRFEDFVEFALALLRRVPIWVRRSGLPQGSAERTSGQAATRFFSRSPKRGRQTADAPAGDDNLPLVRHPHASAWVCA